MFSASPSPLTLSLLSACLVSTLTIPGSDGGLNTLQPFEPTLNSNLSGNGIDPKHYDVPGTQVYVEIQKVGGVLDQNPVLNIIDSTYDSLERKPLGSTMNQDGVRIFTVQPEEDSYYFEVYRLFPYLPVEWEWIADTLTGLRTIMTLPAAQGGIGVRSLEFIGGQGGPFLLWRGWVGVGRPPKPPIDATAQDGTVATT